MSEKASEKILRTARERMKKASDADQENREEQLDDILHLTGRGQWPDDVRRAREEEGKPCLTINQLSQYVRQVTGDIRRMNPAVNITAADDSTEPEMADLVEGLVRRIEYASDAASVYEGAAERAAACGIGWFRVINDWESEDTFDQQILIKSVRNSLAVYVDPEAEEPTRSDAQYLFITSSMGRDEFDDAYPGKSPEDFDHDAGTDLQRYWRDQGGVIIAEYYWKEPVKKKLAMLSDGSTLSDPEQIKEAEALGLVERTRDVESHRVMWAKISGGDVLEGPREVPGRDIPVIAVTGEEWDAGDRTHRSGVIRYAKDAQRVLNYSVSTSAETTALQPKAPWLVTTKHVEGLERFWNEANQKNRPYLPYNPDTQAPAPTRVAPPLSSQGISEQIGLASQFLKTTTGIYDAALGDRSNETSGVAIRQRQMESDISTSIYTDNMAKAIQQAGTVIVGMIPTVYDTSRVLKVMSRDETERDVAFNRPVRTAEGVMVENDLTGGRYSVRISVGPNYSTRRQETAEGMMNFVKAVPGAAAITGDLIAKSMDWPDADQFAERLKKALPPNMQTHEDMSPEEQQALAMQMQQAQMQAQMQQAAQEIAMRKEAAEAKEAEHDATKAGFEVMDTQLEVAAKSGAMNEAIAVAVQQGVARALQGLMQAGPRPY